MKSRESAAPPLDDAGDELLADYEKQKLLRLTAEEVAGVRVLLKRKDRLEWLGSTFKTWAVWIVAVLGAWSVGLDGIRKALKALIGS